MLLPAFSGAAAAAALLLYRRQLASCRLFIRFSIFGVRREHREQRGEAYRVSNFTVVHFHVILVAKLSVHSAGNGQISVRTLYSRSEDQEYENTHFADVFSASHDLFSNAILSICSAAKIDFMFLNYSLMLALRKQRHSI